ncbi:MAG: hypothetical protein EOT04_00095 [Candidatus Chaera renei]|uniref:Peptidase S24/S26A/S26B/S26C domain-containing protein n=1 Tax=Candidatus Chaera renei TaxID=2506947 RepID=A0A4Q0AKL0_9BACT|nr:MAG: hypothetical protein EOT04_00095 [Candidatus Chaera renei]
MLVRRVVGDSMAPSLRAGDIVLTWRRPPQNGHVVVAWQAGREVIKRVAAVKKDRVYLLGDNPDVSSDSRDYGWVKSGDILGVVMLRFGTVKATRAPRPTVPSLVAVPYGLALYTVLVLVYQLLNVSDLAYFIQWKVTGGNLLAVRLAVVAVLLAQLLALPFWLRMRISPALRTFSLACGLLFYGGLFIFNAAAWVSGISLERGAMLFGSLSPLSAAVSSLVLLAAAVWSYAILDGPKVAGRLK